MKIETLRRYIRRTMQEIGIVAKLKILDGSAVDPCVMFVESGVAVYIIEDFEKQLVATRCFLTPGTRDLPPETDEEEIGAWLHEDLNDAIRCALAEHVKRLIANHKEFDRERILTRRTKY